ncbi:MAG: S-adenosylmethionine:tRNA ribosyltransferase-isomerase [Bacteroidales bacterium]
METFHFPIPGIRISDYTYDLPENRIARYPLPIRHDSKLLVYRNEEIKDDCFRNLPVILPSDSLLIFNNTRVVPARLIFRKETGALIEVFCLEPASPKEYILAFSQHASSTWYCAVGNAKRWKTGHLPLYNPENDPKIAKIALSASLIGQEADRYLVRFSWAADIPFSTVLEASGRVPIPPYLKREAEDSDLERYQTVYARNRGSVAAPTAGLHFSDQVIGHMQRNNIGIAELTLHVGAGTFKPVKTPYIRDHIMHSEPFEVSREFLERLSAHEGPVVSVGTTSCRCIESLYYLGLQAAAGRDPLFVGQWEPYVTPREIAYRESIQHLLNYLDKNNRDSLQASTQIIIAPSYVFQTTDILVTNYHQPNSTLLLLVAALTGEKWRSVYDHALTNGYRFLSYGDSCLLYNPESKKIK